MGAVWDELGRMLAGLESSALLRREHELESPVGARVSVGGRELVCLCSNDYLGLACEGAVKQAAIDAVGRWGVGAGASRLVSGTTTLHVELERRLAAFKGAEAAIVTSTGWMANHAAVNSLCGWADLVLCDKLAHASILDACAASGACLRTFPHRDVRRARAVLEKVRARYGRCLIVTDSLFSMDGDIAPLRGLIELKKGFDALLMIDEAHATGVFGPRGRGVAEMAGVEDDIDVSVGTLSKALGALGGFVAGRRVLIETIRNRAPSYMFTTALPPAICAAAAAALEIVRDQPDRRKRLLEMSEGLRLRLGELGLDTGSSASQIIPIIVGPAARAVDLSRRLLAAGFLVPAIRPPAVPRGASRLRISLCWRHEQADLDRLVEELRAIQPMTAS
jgi:8-amino-7-oxononanoate synthase